MDSLIVDLDKVLDDFEAEEKASSHLPGQEVKHTEFAHYVALKEDRPWEDLNQAPINNETTWKLYPSQEHKLSSTGYDDPYIPAENFDLSEADFAPSVLTNEKPYKFSNYSDINNHLQRDLYGDEFQKNLQKIDNNLSNGSVSSSELNIIPQPKAQNEECKYINVNSVHADQNGDLDRKEEIQTTNNKNEINQKHARPTNFTMYNLPSPDAKFPIQARDEFTPVYENQPFPPDLAPALQSKSSLNVSLNMIPENSLKADSMESDRSYSETSVAGSDSSETLPKMLAQNLNLQLSSQESSMNSNNSDKPQKDDDRVNSVSSFNYSDGSVADNSLSNSLAGSDFNSKSQNDNSAIHSMSNTNCIDKPVTFNSSLDSVASLQQSVFAKSTSQEECVESQSEVTMTTEPQSPRYVLNTNYCNTLEDNMVDGNQNMQMMDEEEKQNYVHNDFSSRNELDTEEQTTVAFNRCEIDSGGGDITSSSNAVASKQTVGFGDIDTDMAENDLDSYLEDVTDDTESTKPEVRNHYDSLRNSSPLQYGSLDSFKPLTSHEDTIQTQTFSLDSNVKHASLPSYDQLYSKQCDNPPSYDQLHPTTVAAISDSKSLAEGYTSSNSFNNQNPEENDCVDASSVNVSQISLDSEMPVTLNKSMTASGGARPKESSIFSNSVKNTNAGLVKQEPLETAGTMECVEAPASKENLSSEAELLGIHVIPKETKSDSSPGEIIPKSSTEEEMDEDLAAAIALSLKDAENLPVAQEVSPVLQDPQNQEVNGDLALSVSDQTPSLESSEETEQSSMQHRKRPNSLNLPPRGEGATSVERSQAPYTFPYSSSSEEEVNSADQSYTPENMVVPEVVQNTDAMQTVTDAMAPPPPYSNSTLGKVAPTWIPDSDAANCMGCVSKFTFTKRRHHCRACGKVFCSNCCSMRIRLQYMDNKEARVCHPCHEHITIADISSRTGPGPHPNNPSDYCSTIPPSQQASVAPLSPPSVMVPVGVLKRDGSQKRSEPKHVMFSDGICPGGDLTELDGSSEASSRLPIRRSGRSQKKVERDAKHQAVSKRMRASENKTVQCLIPETGLPPVVLTTENKGECTMDSNPDVEKYLQQIKDESAGPVVFAVNNNLVVLVKIISLDCCVNRICWCFSSRGLCNVGQDEIVIVLETLPNEMTIPRDIFCHLHTVYEEAGKGNTVSDMGHTIFNQSFLDSRDHGGFLYIRPTFQCLHKLILPSPPYVFGILLQKWETPWAKVFPIRLLLRLGAEYRYYPCPLISVRNRKPVFFEIGHTIMNLLADFRNYQYMLPQIRGVSIHMEDKKTCINFPRNRYEDLMKVVGNSNEHVMAVGACFSTEADSHLVCIQNDDGNYQTQAINIQNKPRKVTGASFVVFNGALKTSSGLKAKSSIVEDGLMVQITPESMAALKKSMKEMTEYTIECGSITATTVEEVVTIQWVREDKNINIGVKSPIDGMAMDGIESLHIPNATDYVGEHKVIRWTDVFFIQNLDSGSARWEPVDLSKLADTLSNATCLALTPHLDKLKEASLVKIGLRVHIEAEKVGYEVGSNEEKLPDIFMNDLDNELIPVIHSAASQNHGGSINLELVFHVLD